MEKLKGGLADNMDLIDIAKKHNVDIKLINKEFIKGTKVEREHTSDRKKIKEIVMDHLYEDPKYYSKLKKIEAHEVTSASSSGSYSAPLFSKIKRPISTLHNSKSYNLNESEILKNLIKDKYTYVIGSSSEKKTIKNDENYVKNKLEEIIIHNLFDNNFYLNDLDSKEKKTYLNTFREEISDNLLNNIDKYFDDFFIIDEGKKTIEWKLDNDTNKRIIDNFFKYSKLPEEIKEKYNKLNDINEALGGDAIGQYDAPFTSNKKNPLKIDGVKSIKKSRAVRDKKFPKWGGPDAVFVKIKEKCKKFPYCNQGIGAIELYEIDGIEDSINDLSNELNIPKKLIEKLVINEINKIFI